MANNVMIFIIFNKINFLRRRDDIAVGAVLQEFCCFCSDRKFSSIAVHIVELHEDFSVVITSHPIRFRKIFPTVVRAGTN